MKESNSVRLKMAVGYLIVALLGVMAAVGVWRQIAPLMIEDDSQKLLQQRRMLVSQTLYHLYEAESCGQMLIAGYPDYRERYTEEVEQVHRDIDSLREWTDDSLQRSRLDTLVLLLREKVDGVLALDHNLRASSESAVLHKNIRQIVPLLDSLARHERHDTLVVRDTMRLMPRKKRNFFRRFGDLFAPPKVDSQLVVTTHVEIDTLPRDLGDTIASILEVLERKVMSEHIALYDKARQEGLQLERNNRQVDRRIYRLIVDFEEEETAYLWDRIRSLGEVRRQSLRVMVSVMGGLFLVVLFFVGMLWRDITRSDRYKRRLEQANDRNEVLIEEREKLMLAVTHDIKAPLGAIMGYIDLMARTEREKGCRIYLHRMKEAADRLLGLVTDLLDFYRLDANKISISWIVFSPAELFTTVCESFEPLAGEKGIALRCKLAPELSRRIEGDSSRIRQIVENLLSNAIKFTD
ncbi:MAG: HAMP domain-containing histidine kinase, partial [Alistipes sp.]|nr:HAMP domain-containing histidine kinase [Alistipes sp.]